MYAKGIVGKECLCDCSSQCEDYIDKAKQSLNFILKTLVSCDVAEGLQKMET